MAINSAILSNVYNYYQADLVPKSSSSRFDSHKKKDLQDIYKSIVNISKDEPVFLIDHSKEVERYTIHMKESALRFRNEIGEIGGLDDATIFNSKTVYSSDPDKVSILESRSQQMGEEADAVGEYKVGVTRLATAQENLGKFLPSDEAGLEEGNYSFDVQTSASNYELQFAIGANDTNKDVQNRIARLINNFNLGLTAEVREDEQGNSALAIRAQKVGERSGGYFNISDENTSHQRGVVDFLGIREATTQASGAEYTVNGEIRTANGNEVELGNLYRVKLHATTEEGEEISIGVKPDVESMKDNILSLAGSYNSFLKATAEYVDQQPRTNMLVKDLQTNSTFYTANLNRMGVSQLDDGTIDIDEEKLTESLQNGDTEKELNTLKGFTRFALRKAHQVQINPMDYVDKRIVAYKDPTKSHFPNPYITSAYSGMMFNGYM